MDVPLPDKSTLYVSAPKGFEGGMALLIAGIGAIQASNNLSDEDLSRLNKQLTRLQMVVSLKFQERK